MYLTANGSGALSFSCTDKNIFIRNGIVGPLVMLSAEEAEEAVIGMMPYLGDAAIARIGTFALALDHERGGSGPSPDEQVHSDYPHYPGYLHGCPACEARCFCAPGSAECVYGGEHSVVE